MKLLTSLVIATFFYALVTALQSWDVGPDFAALTAPLTCDGTVVTERFTFSVPGETTITVTHFCERAAGERGAITGQVMAVEFLYLWAFSLLVTVGMARWLTEVGGASLLEGAEGSGEREEDGEGARREGGPGGSGGSTARPGAEDAVSPGTVRRLVSEGRKIEAVDRVRDAYGVGLDEAREWVEQVVEGEEA